MEREVTSLKEWRKEKDLWMYVITMNRDQLPHKS